MSDITATAGLDDIQEVDEEEEEQRQTNWTEGNDGKRVFAIDIGC